MENIKVSIIIPMYNAERFIVHSINSLLGQTLKDIEILVMDDCSPDNSAKIVQETFAGNDKVIYHKMDQNGGPAKARNKGIDIARGEYVTFLDSDDGIVPEALERLYDAAVKFDAEVVQSAGAYVPVLCPTPDDIMTSPEDMLIKIVKDGKTTEPQLAPADYAERIQRVMDGSMGGNVWGKLFKTSFIKDNNLYMPDMKMSEDTIMCFECAMLAKNYVITPYFSVLYRFLGDSLSKGVKTPAFMKKVLDATYNGGIEVEKFMSKHPFFIENPDWKKKMNQWMNSAMEDCYIRPCYQQVGKEALQADEGVNSIWRTYFGELADYVEAMFYQDHDQLPEIPDMFDVTVAYEGMKMQLEMEKNNKNM